MTLFVDSDILLDAVLLRTPFDQFAVKVLSLTDREDHILYSSAHGLLNVYYFACKEAGKAAASKSVGLLEEKLQIAPTNGEAIRKALSAGFSDIEDAVQYMLALENRCEVIITRNLKDYSKSKIPVMSAEQYLKTIE